MLNVEEVLQEVFQALVQLLLHPFFYIAMMMVILHYRRQLILQRKLFHTKLHSLWNESIVTILWGMVAGVSASAALAYWGAVLQYELIFWIWGITFVLVLFKIRFLCISYAIGIVGLIHTGLVYLPDSVQAEEWFRWVEPFVEVKMTSLIGLVGVLHLFEALFIRWQGRRLSNPLLIKGKRGKIIGAFQIQGFWPIPLFLVIPSMGSSLGWSLLVLPIMMGYTELTKTSWPWEKTVRSSNRLLVYSVIVIAMAVLLEYIPDYPYLIAIASLLTIVLHETVLYLSRSEENKFPPKYVQDRRGVKVLGVIPGSPAEQLGIRIGEIVFRVNGIAVRSKEKLHQALRVNSAYCKIECLTLDGEPRILKRAIYAGDHHQLGIILVPDEQPQFFATYEAESFISLFKWDRYREARSYPQIDSSEEVAAAADADHEIDAEITVKTESDTKEAAEDKKGKTKSEPDDMNAILARMGDTGNRFK